MLRQEDSRLREIAHAHLGIASLSQAVGRPCRAEFAWNGTRGRLATSVGRITDYGGYVIADLREASYAGHPVVGVMLPVPRGRPSADNGCLVFQEAEWTSVPAWIAANQIDGEDPRIWYLPASFSLVEEGRPASPGRARLPFWLRWTRRLARP